VGLVAEVCSSLEQLLHCDDIGRHRSSPSGFASAKPVTDLTASTGMSAPPVGWPRH
jgi:hypothetical protein